MTSKQKAHKGLIDSMPYNQWFWMPCGEARVAFTYCPRENAYRFCATSTDTPDYDWREMDTFTVSGKIGAYSSASILLTPAGIDRLRAAQKEAVNA